MSLSDAALLCLSFTTFTQARKQGMATPPINSSQLPAHTKLPHSQNHQTFAKRADVDVDG